MDREPGFPSYLNHRPHGSVGVASVDGLLDKGLLDIIDHQIQTERVVVDKQTNVGTLLRRDTHGIEHVNVDLLTHHSGVCGLGTKLQVGTGEESLVVVGVERELVSLLLVVLRGLARGLERDILLVENHMMVNPTEIDLDFGGQVRVGVQRGNLSGVSSDMDGGDLVIVKDFGIGRPGGEIGVRDVGEIPLGDLALEELVVGVGRSGIGQGTSEILGLDSGTCAIDFDILVLDGRRCSGNHTRPYRETRFVCNELGNDSVDGNSKNVCVGRGISDDIEGDCCKKDKLSGHNFKKNKGGQSRVVCFAINKNKAVVVGRNRESTEGAWFNPKR